MGTKLLYSLRGKNMQNFFASKQQLDLYKYVSIDACM